MCWRWALNDTPQMQAHVSAMSAHRPARPLMKSEGSYTGAVVGGGKTPVTYVGGVPVGKSLVVVH